MEEEWAPTGIDVTAPSTARIYDYLLDGKDNFAADREVAKKVIEGFPTAREAAWTNRRFLGRAVRYLAGEAGIRQFLDIGTGLPTQQNVHEVARRERSDTKVVYVDNDPIVLAHARALLAGSNAVIVQEDLRDPQRILEHPLVAQTLDLDEPVALLLLAIIHFIEDDADPISLVRTVLDALPSGSYLTLTHAALDSYPDAAHTVGEAYQQGGAPLFLRTRATIAGFFDGLDLVDPGLVWAEDWRPETPGHELKVFLAGVARKP